VTEGHVGQPWSTAPTHYTISCNTASYRIGATHQSQYCLTCKDSTHQSLLLDWLQHVAGGYANSRSNNHSRDTTGASLKHIIHWCRQQSSSIWHSNLNIIDALFASCVVLKNLKLARIRAWCFHIIPPTGVGRTPNSRLPVSRSWTSHKNALRLHISFAASVTGRLVLSHKVSATLWGLMYHVLTYLLYAWWMSSVFPAEVTL
jgi:hypothetical protein